MMNLRLFLDSIYLDADDRNVAFFLQNDRQRADDKTAERERELEERRRDIEALSDKVGLFLLGLEWRLGNGHD